MFLAFPAAAWQATDAAHDFARDVRESILSSGLNFSEAADRMGVSLGDLSEWLACRKPMNAFRLTALPDAFWDALNDRRARRRGGLYIPPEVVLLLRGAAMLKKRMAKMLGGEADAQRRARA